jgi:hypothetical protein
MAPGKVGPIGDRFAQQMRQPRSNYMTTEDIARTFRVSRQRVGQIRREDPTFPGRHIDVDGGPIWITAGIDVLAALHRPQAAAGSVFVPNGARILEAAETLARDLGLSFVGAWHLWPAVLTCDPVADAVFATYGTPLKALRKDAARIFPPLDRGRGDPAPKSPSMNSWAQQLFAAGAQAAAARGSVVMDPLDLAIGMIDADKGGPRGRRDGILASMEARGADIGELRRRLEAVRADPTAVQAFEPRKLKPLRRRTPYRPRRLRELLPNGLGHDPWDRKPWGSAFAVGKDDRMLKVDGTRWFFYVDRDGFFVRTPDGRPVCYRWHPPALEPVNGFLEVLPIPPDDVAYWPEYRYPRD